MCGICGYIERNKGKVPDKTIKDMCRVLSHRGPDDEGHLIRSYPQGERINIALGHRRLKIIDLITGHQPMSNEDGTIWIVFNGEIYNFKPLRKELEEKGHRFSTRSDTEVIVHLYEEEKEGCLFRMNGMFALAIWNEKEKTLFLARDRLGIKPLFYCEKPGLFLFASEIKSILQYPDLEREVDPVALHHYLTYQYVPQPHTAFQGVKKLLPGHFLLYRNGKSEVKKYWEFKFQDGPVKKEAYYQEELRALLEDAVRLRLVSDVPFGAFLSGGIDSSIIVGLMSKYLAYPVKTFSMGFAEESFNELKYARITADHFQTEHHEFIVKPPHVVELLPRLIWHFDEPFADSSAIPTYMVSELARKHVTMVLSGDGGDEVFAGYERYLGERLIDFYNIIPRPFQKRIIIPLVSRFPETTRSKDFSRRLKKFAQRAPLDSETRYITWMTIFENSLKEKIYTPAFREMVGEVDSSQYLREYFPQSGSQNFLSKIQYVDTKTYLPEDILVKVDRMSMANALETRVPLLDHRLVEFAANIPPQLKIKGFTMKYIFKRAFSDLLPSSILHRGKHGFGVPIGEWFKGELRDFASRILVEERTLQRGYFNPSGIRKLLDEHQRGKVNHCHRIWSLLVWELWHRLFIDNRICYEPGLRVEDL